MNIANTEHWKSWLWAMDTRFAEFLMALIMFGRGIALALDPKAMNRPIYADFLDIMPQWGWSILCLCGGAFILAGLIINGQWRKSPFLRFTGALVSAVFFAMLTTLFYTGLHSYIAVSAYLPITAASLWIAINISSKS